MIINVAKFDNILTFVRSMKSFTLNFLESIKYLEDRMELKGNLESIRIEMQTMEDKMIWLESFMRIYLEEVQKNFQNVAPDEKQKEKAELMEKESQEPLT
ncbi:hypothetical protein MtrunA17_Chr6g0450431 [Medicago truncatula]|uniref:Uncharacterized protein n=1 Tax=Medicago truncatula TaxID=3880 RepID=A0A396HAX2_MEDTR|nr:hypothetical protein MtrunA17_Chr6g0450431 [Medicago truncatula]